jgi:hypothetical protein
MSKQVVGSSTIKEMVALGFSREEIKKRCNKRIAYNKFNAIYRHHINLTKSVTRGVEFGSKTTAYYDNEDLYGSIPKYKFSELSIAELEFYNSFTKNK